jgi:tetratricopeptide (TPR) repeat protein
MMASRRERRALTYHWMRDHGLGDYDNAVRSLLHTLPIVRAHHARRHIALCLLKLGYAHEALRRYPEAIGYLSQARDTFGELRLTRRAESAQQALDRCRQALRGELVSLVAV